MTEEKYISPQSNPLIERDKKNNKQNPDLDYTGNRIHLILKGIAKLNVSQSKSFIFNFIQSYSKRVLCLEWYIWRVPHILLVSHG